MSDGPRGVKPEEFDSLMKLVNLVFHRDTPGGPTMRDEYPHLFAMDNLENLRVIQEDGRIVSHVGTTLRNAVILGCHVRVGNIGAVSTHPDSRGRGYAGACFDDACANARASGVDFMLISGDRKLYRRAGCRRVGQDHRFTLTPESAAALRTNVTLEPYSDRHLPAVRCLYENEPVRYLRPLEEWQRFIRDGKSTQHYSELWVVRRNGDIVAYAAAFNPDEHGATSLEEFAGDRPALLGALSQWMTLKELKSIGVHVQSHDLAARALLADQGRTESGPGATYLVIHFTQLMERLRPLMEERVGTLEATRLSFREYNGLCGFACDGETVLSLDRGAAAQFIWGTREPQEWQWTGEGDGKRILSAIFPIPSLVYGFSYV